MASSRARRGYLDRLVDALPVARGGQVRAPKQISWGPTRPVATLDEDPPATEDGARRAAASAGDREPEPTPSATPITRDVAAGPQFPTTPPDAVPPAPARAQPAVVTRPAGESDAAGRRSTPGPHPRALVVPVAQRTSQSVQAPPPRPEPTPDRDRPTPASASAIPAAVTAALARLSAVSMRTPVPHPVAPQAGPRTRSPLAPPVSTSATPPAERPAAVVVATRVDRDDVPPPAPQVHIGSIDVTIQSPPAPPVPVPAPVAPPRAAAPASPPERLSRPVAGYGFGQG